MFRLLTIKKKEILLDEKMLYNNYYYIIVYVGEKKKERMSVCACMRVCGSCSVRAMRIGDRCHARIFLFLLLLLLYLQDETS